MLRGRILNKLIEFMRKTLVYTSHVDVYAWFPDGQVKEVSQGDGIYYHPCINPEGTHVVYHGGALGDIYRVWKADINTCDVVPLTPSDSAAWHPVFSWDGKKIVFSSNLLSGHPPARIKKSIPHGIAPKNHIVNLFIMDSEGGSVQKITTGPYQDQRPTFSPDGKHIAFVSLIYINAYI